MWKRLYNKLNAKVNNLYNKIPEACTSIQTNQYNTDRQNLEKNIREVENKIPDISGLVTTTGLTAKIGEVERKKPVSGLGVIFLLQKLVKVKKNTRYQ